MVSESFSHRYGPSLAKSRMSPVGHCGVERDPKATRRCFVRPVDVGPRVHRTPTSLLGFRPRPRFTIIRDRLRPAGPARVQLQRIIAGRPQNGVKFELSERRGLQDVWLEIGVWKKASPIEYINDESSCRFVNRIPVMIEVSAFAM